MRAVSNKGGFSSLCTPWQYSMEIAIHLLSKSKSAAHKTGWNLEAKKGLVIGAHTKKVQWAWSPYLYCALSSCSVYVNNNRPLSRPSVGHNPHGNRVQPLWVSHAKRMGYLSESFSPIRFLLHFSFSACFRKATHGFPVQHVSRPQSDNARVTCETERVDCLASIPSPLPCHWLQAEKKKVSQDGGGWNAFLCVISRNSYSAPPWINRILSFKRVLKIAFRELFSCTLTSR